MLWNFEDSKFRVVVWNKIIWTVNIPSRNKLLTTGGLMLYAVVDGSPPCVVVVAGSSLYDVVIGLLFILKQNQFLN